jgi:iron complex outermembrane receptor protein
MRLSVVVAAISLSIIGLAVADDVRASVRKPTNIPAQSLGAALEALAKDRNLQVVYVSEELTGLRTHGALGEFTSEEALKQLLAGTGMTFRYLDENTVTIVRVSSTSSANGNAPVPADSTPPASTPGDSQPEGKKSSSEPFRVAQVDQGQTSSSATVEKESGQPSKRKSVPLEEVIVTGSRIPETAGQQVQPVRSYTREDMDKSGQGTVVDFLNTLPDVSIASTETTNNLGTGWPGKTTVQLHGLPIGTTLVLLNGQRTETMANFGIDFFDLSNVPQAAIERIDMLPVGASAIYGADALGGAVNFILRKEFDGVEVDGNFSHAADLNDKGVNLSLGKGWDQGSIALFGTYQERAELWGYEREATSTTTFPPNAPSFFLTDVCSPGNVYSLNGQNLPGLSSPQTGIPPGISGTPTLAQFASTAEKLNLCNAGHYTTWIPSSDRAGLLLTGHFQATDAVDLFTEVLFSHNDGQYSFAPLITASSANGITLGANNPYNPFGEAVGVSFAYSGLPNIENTSGEFIRPLIGIRGSIFSDWHYEATAFLSRDHWYYNAPGGYGPDANALQAALESPDRASALNPFSTSAPGSPQLLQSIAAATLAHDAVYDHFYSQTAEGQAVLRGPLLNLPAGPVVAAIGSEYQVAEQRFDAFGPGAASVGGVQSQDFQRHTYAFFLETRVPLLANHNRQAATDVLVLTAGGRYDHTNDFGGKATWQSGLLWQPTQAILVRGGYGISYQAPTPQEIGGPLAPEYGSVGTDPFRGGAPVVSTIVYGSNPNLRPQTGDSRSLGIEYASQGLPGFQTSLTYFAIKISHFIGQPNPQTIIDNPSLYPGGVTRAPPTPQDVQEGFLGQIIRVNDLYYNFGDLQVAGFDTDLRYAIDTHLGRLTPSIAIANIDKWTSALVPGAPTLSYVSQAGTNPSWAPRWKGTAALGWQEGRLSATFSGRYVGPYKDYQFTPNTNELGNFWNFDFNTRYEFGNGLIGKSPDAGAYVSIGAINLFNKLPPFSYGYLFDSTQYDIRGRIIYAHIGLKW